MCVFVWQKGRGGLKNVENHRRSTNLELFDILYALEQKLRNLTRATVR